MIDARDARGGFSFASKRNFALSEENDALRETTCVWIAPPGFRPEPVASRMVARAADRGAFQLGVFQDGAELSFATLAAVTEFVRRVYLRSGGGDGLDGGGTPVPLIPPEPGPDLPPTPTEVEGGESATLTLVKAFVEAGDNQKGSLIKGKPFTWTNHESIQAEKSRSYQKPMPVVAGQPAPTPAIIERAVFLILREILQRFPSNNNLGEIDRWQTASRAL